jgi:hypothetical protein
MGTLRRVFVFAAMSASAVHAVATSAADQPTTTSVVATVVPSASDSNSSVPAEGDDLGPTSAPPWNPPRACCLSSGGGLHREHPDVCGGSPHREVKCQNGRGEGA